MQPAHQYTTRTGVQHDHWPVYSHQGQPHAQYAYDPRLSAQTLERYAHGHSAQFPQTASYIGDYFRGYDPLPVEKYPYASRALDATLSSAQLIGGLAAAERAWTSGRELTRERWDSR